MFSLDIETAPTKETNNPYALEPFRYHQGLAGITSIAVAGPDNYLKQITNMEELPSLLKSLKGKVVFCHNAIFDVTWMLEVCGDFNLIKDITWQDTMLLAKWILNSQEIEYGVPDHHASSGKFSFSLSNLCKTFLPDHPRLKEFIGIKSVGEYDGGADKRYWLERGCLDAIMTLALAKELKSKLPIEQIRGFLIEQNIIPYIARSWSKGVKFDKDYFDELTPKIAMAKVPLLKRLELEGTVISSPKQLSNYLFNDLGLTPISTTAKGAGSTAAGDLKMLALKNADNKAGQILKMILNYKKLITLESKYVKGFAEVYDYVGESICYACPRIFSTYTGRFTYGSKTLKKGNYKVSIAMHQLPRKSPVKRGLIAPEGRKLFLSDAMGQEMRIMGQMSLDENILNGFNNDLDLHSDMGAHISGEAYSIFAQKLLDGDKEAINFRTAAKLLNLSCQYRISYNSLKVKFFDTYDIQISIPQAQQYLNMYKKRYTGIIKYWNKAILLAKEKGYTESISGRRFGLSNWSTNKWMTESSSINFPIQASGADHLEATIWKVSKKYPEIEFLLQVHDQMIYSIPNDVELARDILHFINKINYSKIWDKEIHLPLIFDGFIGDNFKEIIEII